MSATPDTKTEEKAVTPFVQLGLKPELLKVVTQLGYEVPSPIQASAIPELLKGRDLIGVAQTGTGKTAAFALPLLSRLDNHVSKPQILCLAPTRELAIQVADAFQTYSRQLAKVNVLAIYGGADYRGQLRSLKQGCQVVVGTPGRVMDHMRRGSLDLSGIQAIVLDEADEMLRMGFIDDVEWVLSEAPKTRQLALFSATMPPAIKRLSQKYLVKPAEITVAAQSSTNSSIRQRYVQTNNHHKLETLTRILEVEEFDGVIVFVRTKNQTAEIAERLQGRGYSSAALNGDVPQNRREQIITHLKNKKIDILVATDVAARGLDVPRISLVINYDAPFDAESYVHRIGRTGRAGRDGDAIIFVNAREKGALRGIERTTKRTIEAYEFPSLDQLNQRKTEQVFKRIDEEVAKDLKDYTSVVSKYIEHRPDVSLAHLAAAFASIEAKGQPFYLKDISTPPKDHGQRGDKFERKKEGARSNRDRGVRSDTYRLDVGQEDGLVKGQLVRLLAENAGLDSKFIGAIELNGSDCFVELPEGMAASMLTELAKTRVCGKAMQLVLDPTKRIARQFNGTKPKSGHRGKPSGGRRNRSDRSSFKRK